MDFSDVTFAWAKMFETAGHWVSSVGKAQQATLTAAARHLELMLHTSSRLWGEPPQEVLPSDRRFKDEAWRENPAFELMKQIYLITAQWMLDVVDGVQEINPDLHKRTAFWTQQLADAMSPTNFAATNPAVLQEMMRTGGASLVRGIQNLLADLQKGQISQVPEGSFEIGQDLATTPGQVVFRNPLIELIQYTPTTAQVYATPILAIPPWINKYYVMDLRPQNSMLKYLVDEGFATFVISWKNPDDSILHLEWADYMEQGPIAALRAIQAITGSEQVNTAGYCLGGIIEQVTLAYLAAQGDTTVNAATFFTTHQDFTDVGDIEVFLSKPEVRLIEWLMKASGGYLEGRNMGATFNMLRANDLLWHYVIHNYLMGQDPPAFDLLYWNGDGTRVPGKVHSFLLREFFLENKLKEPDGIQIRGIGIDTRRITAPTYAVACDRDHIVPWRGAALMRQLHGGPVRFVLAESGHIAGVINHPAANRRAYRVNENEDAQALDVDAWLAGAEAHAGSWWPDWIAWLRERSGPQVSPPEMGGPQYPPLADAPGTYVLEK
jgi:polyhydroxyalkanoate synthase